MSVNAVVYLRISEDREGDELGVTRQREDCIRLAEARGYAVIEVATDNDLSALTKRTRPGFERVIELLETDRATVVISWTFERLLKTRRDQLRFIELGQAKNAVLALARGADLDMSNPGGRLLADILASIARNETELKSDRQIRAYRQAAEQGKPHFVARPYGYTRQGELVEAEAAILNQIAQHFITGWSTTEITTWLNEHSIPAASGGSWSRRVVKDHLLSKRNAGIRVYKGEEYPGQWTPIYSPDLHARITAEWTRRHGGQGKPRADNRKYLLTGLLYCGLCGHKMAGGANHDRAGLPSRYKYRCIPGDRKHGCGNLMRVAVTLDHLVSEAVLYRLDSPEMRALLIAQESRTEDIAPLLDHQQALRSRLEDLLVDYTDSTLTKSEYVKARGRVQTKLVNVEAELATLYSSEQTAAMLSPAQSLRSAWQENSVGWQRKLLELVIERITVERSHKRTPYVIGDQTYKFDPEAIDIKWRA